MDRPELSVVIPVWRGVESLRKLLPHLKPTLQSLVPEHEIIVSLGPGYSLPSELADAQARFVQAAKHGYGDILREGLEHATGRYVLTMDADFSHRPGYANSMWAHRDQGDILIGSRYVPGSFAEMHLLRRAGSRLLNFFYRKTLALPCKDVSSGFRLYRRDVLEEIGPPEGHGLDSLLEMIVKATCQGSRIVEVPFWYKGASSWTRTRMLRLSLDFLATFGKLLALRNSVKAADYDSRAFDSWIPLQRYWQRRRFHIIQTFAPEAGRILDIGCGSSRIIQMLPDVVGMDIAMRKLRWLRAPGRRLVCGSLTGIPFRDHAFDAAVCSEVIEHLPRQDVDLRQVARKIRPGGILILSTPDYDRRIWRLLEWAYGKVFPGGYVHEHINRYTHKGLRRELEGLGLDVLDCQYVGGSEMIFKARVPEQVAVIDLREDAVKVASSS
ncbi:MAG: methyltransferase domain-containing protein [Actinomycetota bacterium]|nr:methyltransferase domain-containing protein [Actinomycetota bacterium]